MTYYKESGEKISTCSECGAQRICKIGALWILNFTVRASYQIINRTTNSVFVLHQNSISFLRATMFRISTKEKFNDKNPSVKRLRFRFHWRLLRKFAKKSRNPLPPQRKSMGQRNLLVSTTMNQDLQGKVSHQFDR